MEEFQKSVTIWWSYAWNTPDSFFFRTRCRYAESTFFRELCDSIASTTQVASFSHYNRRVFHCLSIASNWCNTMSMSKTYRFPILCAHSWSPSEISPSKTLEKTARIFSEHPYIGCTARSSLQQHSFLVLKTGSDITKEALNCTASLQQLTALFSVHILVSSGI